MLSDIGSGCYFTFFSGASIIRDSSFFKGFGSSMQPGPISSKVKKNGAVRRAFETDISEPSSHLVLILVPIGSLFSYIGSTVSVAVDFYSKFGLKIFIPFLEGELTIYIF